MSGAALADYGAIAMQQMLNMGTDETEYFGKPVHGPSEQGTVPSEQGSTAQAAQRWPMHRNGAGPASYP